MPQPEKSRISASFDKAARHYDARARFQHGVCNSLLALLSEAAPTDFYPGRVLDAGCGTGYGSALLKDHWPGSAIMACDLSPEMLRLAQHQPCQPLCADMEALPFREGTFDLVWSSLALQWCRSPDVYEKLLTVLSHEGILAFSTLASGTLTELEQAFSHSDDSRHVRHFMSTGQTRAALEQAGFTVIRLVSEKRIERFADFKALFESIKGIGASQVGAGRRKSLMGKAALKQAQARYDRLRDQDGLLPLTYELVMGIARKPG